MNNTLRKPDLVYDVNSDSLVNAYDVTLIQNAITAGRHELALDVNASGRVDVYDRDAVSARVGNAAAVSTAMALISAQSTCTGGVDINAAQSAIGSTRGSKTYSASYDADSDGMVTANDIALLRTASASCQ